MDFKKHPLNQSLITKFLYKGDEKEDICPRKIYHLHIIRSHHYVTESMQKGKYFETLCLGKSAGGKSTADLPRKRLVKVKEQENIKRKAAGLPEILGEKTMDQLRIEQQAKRFQLLCAKYQVTVVDENSQVKVTVPWHKNPEIYLSMEYDIFPTAIMTNEERLSPTDTGLRLAIIDLKLTADVNATFGEFSWGAPEFMDHIQPFMYHYGARELIKNIQLNPYIKDLLTKNVADIIRENNLRFYYWVFNYKKEVLDDKLIKVSWDTQKEQELHESIRKTINLIDFYEKLEWPVKPDYKRCKECTIFECKSRQNVQTV